MSLQDKTQYIIKNLIYLGFYICLITLSLNLIFFIIELINYKPKQSFFHFITSNLLASGILFTIIGYLSVVLYSIFLMKSKYRNLYVIVLIEVIIGSALIVTYFYSGLS